LLPTRIEPLKEGPNEAEGKGLHKSMNLFPARRIMILKWVFTDVQTCVKGESST